MATLELKSLPKEQNLVICAYLRTILMGYMSKMGLTPAQEVAYTHWVKNLRRGLDKFFPRSAKGGFVRNPQGFRCTINGKTYTTTESVEIVPMEIVKGWFFDYLKKQ